MTDDKHPARPIPDELACKGCGGGIQPEREGAELCRTCLWTKENLTAGDG